MSRQARGEDFTWRSEPPPSIRKQADGRGERKLKENEELRVKVRGRRLPGVLLAGREGNTMLTCIITLSMLVVILGMIVYSVSLRLANEASVRLEDGLAASCMAGLNIDLEQFRDSYASEYTYLVVGDVQESYHTFRDTLRANIDEERNDLISNVTITTYVVYNVVWDRERNHFFTETFVFDDNGCVEEYYDENEFVFSPNGIRIERTSVYGEVAFDLKLFGTYHARCNRRLLTQADRK